MHNVGEVLFLLDKKTQAIIPCMIVERINSVSLEGEKTHHVLVSPSGKKFQLEDYKNPWFSNTEDARDFLISASTRLIDRVIEEAEAKAKASFETTTIAEGPDQEELSEQSEKSVKEFMNDVVVDLGNGQTAKVSLASESV